MSKASDIFRAMARYEAMSADARHDDPAPYTDTRQQRAEAAVGLVRALAPYIRAGMAPGEALAVHRMAVARATLRDR